MRESVEIQIEAAIHQCDSFPIAQRLFLLGAIQQVIQLIGERVFGILFEERLKWTFAMLFVGGCEIVSLTEGLSKRGLSNAACTNDDDEFVHTRVIL